MELSSRARTQLAWTPHIRTRLGFCQVGKRDQQDRDPRSPRVSTATQLGESTVVSTLEVEDARNGL